MRRRTLTVGVLGAVLLAAALLTFRAVASSGAGPVHTLPLAGIVQGSYAGPTAFGTSPVGHAVCNVLADGSICATPLEWRYGRHVDVGVCGTGPCFGYVGRFLVVNRSDVAFAADLATSQWVTSWHVPIDSVSFASVRGAFPPGPGCAALTGTTLTLAPSSRATVCVDFSAGGEAFPPQGSVELGTLGQWSSRYGSVSGGPLTLPIVALQPSSPIESHDVESPVGQGGDVALGTWAILSPPPVRWRVEDVTTLAGRPLTYRTVGPAPAWLTSSCTSPCVDAEMSYAYPHVWSSQASSDGVELHFVVRGSFLAHWRGGLPTRQHVWKVDFQDVFADFQYACTATGCATARLGALPAAQLQAQACPSGAVTVDETRPGPEPTERLCLAFATPPGSRLQALGFDAVVRGPEPGGGEGVWGATNQESWVLPYGRF